MSKKLSRTDKWRLKQWYMVKAPEIFGSVDLYEVPATKPESLLGATLEISLYELTKDFTHQPVKLKFQIIDIKGNTAYTKVKMHFLTRDYIKSFIERRNTKVLAVTEAETKDGYRLRFIIICILRGRRKTSQERAARKIIVEFIKKKCAEKTFAEVIKDVAFDRYSEELSKLVHKISPVVKVLFAKTKILKEPEEAAASPESQPPESKSS